MVNAIRSQLLDGLLGRQTAAVLSVVLARPETRLYQRQIAQLAGLRLLQAQRALRALADLGVLLAQREGNRVYYSPDPSCAILPELTAMVLKTAGLADVVREALDQVEGIHLAFIFGSMAKGAGDSKSDVDVLIVGDGSFADISAALLPAQERLGREITPTVYSGEEFQQRVAEKHHFLARVLSEAKIMLIGTPDDLERMGQDAPRRPGGGGTAWSRD
jgi:predicted nucleotidyltransferase